MNFFARIESGLAFGLVLLLSSPFPLHAADPDAADPEVVLAEAMAKIEDDAVVRAWTEGAAEITPENAEAVIRAAEAERAAKKQAFEAASKACQSRFLVNRCIDQAKQAQFEQDRALRRIIERAQDVERAERTREIEERRARAQAEPKREPMKLREPRLKEPAKPMDITPKTVKEPSKPMDIAPKTVKEPSKPVDSRPAEVRAEQSEAERAELEAANLKAYEERQRRAAERMARIEEIAAKRKAEREENRRHFEETLKAREEAQKRYEERREQGGNGRQSLSEFF